MGLLLTLSTSMAVLAGAAGAAGAEERAPQGEAGARERIIRAVETGLPVVAGEGRTLRLSLQEWMKALGVPGASVAVIDGYEIAWAKGYGVTDAGKGGEPVTAQTLFQAASISKPFAALAVLHFAEQGTFDLDADINTYLKSWKLPRDGSDGTDTVTLRRLLAHTAGITPGGFAGYERGAPLPGIVQILEGEPPASNRAARVVSEPGSEVSYSGLGYTIIQLALTERLGKPFESIIKETIFDPVGMRDSTFEQVLPEALAARAAHGHLAGGEVVPGSWHVYPELAAAGMWTTATDLGRLAIEIAKSKKGISNRILSTGMTGKMLTQQKDQMGLGFVIRPGGEHGYFAHSGGNMGYRCHFEMLADTGQGVVVMTNSDVGGMLMVLLLRSVSQAYEWPSRREEPLSASITDEILAQVDGSTPVRKEVEVADPVLARHVGRYELAPDLVFEVTHVPGHLEVRLGDQPRFPVYAESETEFFYKVVDAQITFVRNEAGDTVSLVLRQGGRDQEAKRIE